MAMNNNSVLRPRTDIVRTTRTAKEKTHSGYLELASPCALATRYSPGKNSTPAGRGGHRVADKVIYRFIGILLPVLLLMKHTRGGVGHVIVLSGSWTQKQTFRFSCSLKRMPKFLSFLMLAAVIQVPIE